MTRVMRGPVTRNSGLPGALVGLVAASALVCGLSFYTDASRAASGGVVGVSEDGGLAGLSLADCSGAVKGRPDLSWVSTGLLSAYELLLGPTARFWALGECPNILFYAWSRPICWFALVWYGFDSVKRQMSVGMPSTEYIGRWLMGLFLVGGSFLTHLVSMPQILLFSCLFFWVDGAEAVTCQSCHDQIPGCTGGSDCPLFTRVAANAAILVGTTAAALSLKDLLPIKFLRFLTKGFLEAAKVMANRSAPGTAVDWASLSMVEVARAPARGLGTRADAIGVLQERVGAATEAIEVARGQALISSLQQFSGESKASRSKESSGAILGCYTFFLAEASKIVEHYGSLSSASLDLEEDSAAGVGTSRQLKGTIRHPKRELDFFFLLLVWSMILVSVGMETFLTVASFLVFNVFDHMLLRKWDWRVTYFYFVILLERVETSGDDELNISSVATRLGGLDTLREEATLRAEEHFGRYIFRRRQSNSDHNEGESSEKKSLLAWNGKSTPTAEHTCHAFNLGPSGKHGKGHLLADGTCKFAHKCDAFVSNNGPSGRCLGDHPRHKCTNPARIAEAQA
jgi:hypothetical protein